MKTKRHVISAVATVLVVAGLAGGTYAAGLKPRLGLDLQGGLSVTLTAPEGTRTELLDKAVEVLRGRVDRVGVAEPEITREGTTNIFIQLPGTGDPQRLLDLIGKTAQLQFRQVLESIPKSDPKFKSTKVSPTDDPKAEIFALSDDKESKLKLAKPEMTGDQVRRASARPASDGSAGWEVALDFKSEGNKKWKEFTGKLACLQGDQRRIAVVLDGIVESSPQVGSEVQCNEGISGSTSITGAFDEKEGRDLSVALNSGALPVKLEQSEVRTVSPTLGRDSLRAGLLAGFLGLAAVMIYVLIYYRSLGLQTWAGLAVFSSAIYGLVVAFGALIGWNLTLAVIAGLIVAVGIATDSYIVFFERIKEEIHAGRSLKASIDKGFVHAWRTMRTANAVTILAAIILYILAVGPVRGFALALGMATVLDLLITYALTWPLAALLARSSFFSENKLLGMRAALEGGKKEGSLLRKVYRSEFKVDFIGRRKLWFLISGVLVGASALLLLPGVKGLTYGIDFRGGTIYRAPSARAVTVPQVTAALEGQGLANPIVQILQDRVSRDTSVQVQTESTLNPGQRRSVLEALSKVTGAKPEDVDTEAVGQKWGRQITVKALRGLLIFLVLVVAYMSWRLEPKMAVAGIVALAHDLLITAGIYALVGFEVTPATVIATLTILGYSLYDTVVVFDKIKENESIPANARKPFDQIANESTNHVLMRSINTSLTVLLPVGALLVVGSSVVGADTLKDLALALFVGIAAGTYSSIFTATPLLSLLKRKESRYAGLKAKAVAESRKAGKSPAFAAPNGEPATSPGSEKRVPVGAGVAGKSRPRPATPPQTDAGPPGRQAPRRKVSRAKRKKSGGAKR